MPATAVSRSKHTSNFKSCLYPVRQVIQKSCTFTVKGEIISEGNKYIILDWAVNLNAVNRSLWELTHFVRQHQKARDCSVLAPSHWPYFQL